MKKVIKVTVQRSRADTYKFGYRFRTRSNSGNRDYGFTELKELSKTNSFEFIFNDVVPQEQRDHVFKIYSDIGLTIINTTAERPDRNALAQKLGLQ